MDPYQALANAIVEVAVKDYKIALKYHYRHPGRKDYADEVAALEKFFRSDWYGMLTNLNGELLMNGVRRMVRQEVVA